MTLITHSVNIFGMNKKPAPIAPIIKSMAKNLGLEPGMDLYLLKDQWADLIGNPIAFHTMPQAIRYHTLTLYVDSDTWMHALTFHKETIRQKVNTRLGKETIRSIRLKLAPILSPSGQKKKANTEPSRTLSIEIADMLQVQLASVSDDDLKRVIRKAMTRHLQESKTA